MDHARHKHTTGVIFFVTIFSYVKNQSLNTTSLLSSDCSPDWYITEIQCKAHNPQIYCINFTWTIDWFHTFNRKTNKKYFTKSPVFSAATNDKIKWYLELGPKSGENESTFSLFPLLSTDNKNRKVWYKYRVDILDENLNSVWSSFCPIFYDVPMGSYSIPKKSELDDTMIIWLRLAFYEDAANASRELVVPKNNSSNTTCTSTTCECSSNYTNRLTEMKHHSDYPRSHHVEGVWTIAQWEIWKF